MKGVRQNFRKVWMYDFIRDWMTDGVESAGASDLRLERKDPAERRLGTLMPQDNSRMATSSKE